MSNDTEVIVERLDRIEHSVKDIQLTLENETNRNIRIIENELRQIKDRLDDIA